MYSGTNIVTVEEEIAQFVQTAVVSTRGVSFIVGWRGKANWWRIVWGGGGWTSFHL